MDAHDVADEIAVTVLGGYLGAGKTTMLNRILAEAPAGTAVLVNDFGAIAIDAGLVDSASAEDGIVSLTNGCICCTIADGFVEALETIQRLTPRPQRLVIEASGVSRPGDVAAYAHLPGFRLDAIVVVADVEQILTRVGDRYVGDVVVDQLAAADLLVLNKADLVTPERLTEVAERISDHAPSAAVLTAERGDVPLAVLLDRTSGADGDRRPTADLPLPGSRGASGAVFETWSCTIDEPLDHVALDLALTAVPEEVVRLKGIVRTVQQPDRRTVIHRVGPRIERTDGGPWGGGPSHITAIGVATRLPPGWLDEHFSRARVASAGAGDVSEPGPG